MIVYNLPSVIIFSYSFVLQNIEVDILKEINLNRNTQFDTYTFLEKITSGGSPSFPSGHTHEAFAIAIALCFAYPRWFVIIPSIIWAITIGYSRMLLGVHYPSDVLVGAIIGIASDYACYKGQHLFRSKDSIKAR